MTTKICNTCGKIGCTQHKYKKPKTTDRGLGHKYQKIRKQVLRQEKTCWLCDQPGTHKDPLTTDHFPISRAEAKEKGIPLKIVNHRSNLRAAHRSCNSKRGDGLK